MTTIAKQIGRSTSTVSREVNQRREITGYLAFSTLVTRRNRQLLKRGKIANMLSIDERPVEVADRTIKTRSKFTIVTGIQVYFAYPGSPWERGTKPPRRSRKVL